LTLLDNEQDTAFLEYLDNKDYSRLFSQAFKTPKIAEIVVGDIFRHVEIACRFALTEATRDRAVCSRVDAEHGNLKLRMRFEFTEPAGMVILLEKEFLKELIYLRPIDRDLKAYREMFNQAITLYPGMTPGHSFVFSNEILPPA
jgi:hypothetical protein